MNRQEILDGLVKSNDFPELVELVARARGRGPSDSITSTQRILVRVLLGGGLEDELATSHPDDSIPDELFGRTLVKIADTGFPEIDEASSALLHWWLLLTANDLIGIRNIEFNRFVNSAEIALTDFDERAHSAFEAGNYQEQQGMTYCGSSIVFETLRTISRCKTIQAVSYLWSVHNRKALKFKQWRIPVEGSLTALAAIGTDDAKLFLHEALKNTDKGLSEWANFVLNYSGQGDYDQVEKLADAARAEDTSRQENIGTAGNKSGCLALLMMILLIGVLFSLAVDYYTFSFV
ncbi:hypothetical protein L0156_10285 [bacterium]|nr:hypothetical protein [bacterium]